MGAGQTGMSGPGLLLRRHGYQRGVLPPSRPSRPPTALLCDRDGTLLEDVPYNADPAEVRPLVGVPESLELARAAGLRVAVVTNQSGVAKGLIQPHQLRAVHRRMIELLGPFDAIVACPHDDDDGCTCRKPRPGMVCRVAELLGVPTAECVMVGDTVADVHAAYSAGATGVLVPNDRTRPIELRGVAHVHPDFRSAVEQVIEWRTSAP
jgi:histidinol-phosphate phosphatase family protein